VLGPVEVRVSLVAFKGLAPAESLESVFHKGEISIGRSVENDFVIDDPERVCSRSHAVIYHLNDGLYIEDTSSSYTVLNDREKIERGHKRRLQSGDRISIGDADLQISFSEYVQLQENQSTGNSESGLYEAFSIEDFFSGSSDKSLPEGDRHAVEIDTPNIPFAQTGDVFQVESTSTEVDAFDFSDLAGFGESDECLQCAEPDVLCAPEAVVESERTGPETSISVQELSSAVDPRHTATEAAIHAFFDGLGVPLKEIKNRDLVDVLGDAGAMTRTLVEGVMEMLQSRGDVKREFGMDTTQISGVMNNPLKFSVGTDDALLKLLAGAEGFIKADDAILEGVMDAKAHQMAVMSGMQAALGSLLRRFEPDVLEKRLENRFVLSRKARYWELYRESYEQLVDEAEDNFNALFGDEFARVYMEQTKALKK